MTNAVLLNHRGQPFRQPEPPPPPPSHTILAPVEIQNRVQQPAVHVHPMIDLTGTIPPITAHIHIPAGALQTTAQLPGYHADPLWEVWWYNGPGALVSELFRRYPVALWLGRLILLALLFWLGDQAFRYQVVTGGITGPAANFYTSADPVLSTANRTAFTLEVEHILDSPVCNWGSRLQAQDLLDEAKGQVDDDKARAFLEVARTRAYAAAC